GEVHPVRVPTPEEESERAVVRLRREVVKDRTCARNRVNSQLRRLGLRYPKKTRWTQDHRQWLRTVAVSPWERVLLEERVAAVEQLDQRLHRIEQQMAQLATSERYRT